MLIFGRHGFAWGLFDKDGVKDQIGTLNLLTPETVMRAKDEIKTGNSVALNWGLDKLSQPTMGRSVLKHEHVNWRDKPDFPFYSWDDEISINTQTGNFNPKYDQFVFLLPANMTISRESVGWVA